MIPMHSPNQYVELKTAIAIFPRELKRGIVPVHVCVKGEKSFYARTNFVVSTRGNKCNIFLEKAWMGSTSVSTTSASARARAFVYTGWRVFWEHSGRIFKTCVILVAL